MAIPKGKTLSDTSKADEAELEKRAKQYDALIAQVKEEIKLRKDAFEQQKKFPKKLTPDYEYETTDEWSKLLIAQWQFDLDSNLLDLNYKIEELTRKKMVLTNDLKGDD